MIDTLAWEETISELVTAPGVVMVIGGADTGKTTFCTRLCNAGFEAGVPTAVVDADVGQSEIGAPGTVGMAMADKPVEALSDFKAKRLYFVGNTTPVGHTLEAAIGAKRMVDAALEMGAKLVILDTTGMVEGAIGRKLKTYKADLVRPDYILGIQKKHEIERLLMPFAKVSSIKIRKVTASEQARKKPPQYRAARRQLSFYKHFKDAINHIIRLDDVSCWNTWFGTGRPMKWQYIKFIENTLRCRVLYAEIVGKSIFIVSEQPCARSGYADLEEEFKTRDITVVPANQFSNLLVGLADENANTLNVGLIQAIDFKQRLISIATPMKTVSPIRVVQFGTLQIAKDGKQIGTVKQGEL